MRSGSEHCGSRVAVEQGRRGRRGRRGGRGGGGEEEEEQEEQEEEQEEQQEEEATDIKSNNPHLAGGEKIGVGKKVSTIAMLGPLLAMPSGQGLNMTLLAILKVNRAN